MENPKFIKPSDQYHTGFSISRKKIHKASYHRLIFENSLVNLCRRPQLLYPKTGLLLTLGDNSLMIHFSITGKGAPRAFSRQGGRW
jgi:hypothetical protein